MAITFAFLILPEVHLMDLAGPDQTLHEAICFGADFQIKYAVLDHNPQSSAGLPLGNLPSFSSLHLQPGDFLIIPGSPVEYLLSTAFQKQTALFHWLRVQHQAGVQLISICAGAFVLAQAGLLDGLDCTTHFQRTRQLQSLFPKTNVKENVLFVESDRILTSAGIASGIDLTLFILEKMKGPFFAHKVAR
jgi:transcriptional regulator GlxA family with amidase domain